MNVQKSTTVTITLEMDEQEARELRAFVCATHDQLIRSGSDANSPAVLRARKLMEALEKLPGAGTRSA